VFSGGHVIYAHMEGGFMEFASPFAQLISHWREETTNRPSGGRWPPTKQKECLDFASDVSLTPMGCLWKLVEFSGSYIEIQASAL